MSQAKPERRYPAHPPVLSVGNRSALIFLTVCTKDRRRLLASPAVAGVLLGAWRAADAWAVGRYVVMPDHVHLFCASVDLGFSLGQWVSFWKHGVTREMHRRGLCEGQLWQRDHWDTQLRQGEDYQEKWEYVKNNPVRAGLVGQAEVWPYQGEMQTLMWHDMR